MLKLIFDAVLDVLIDEGFERLKAKWKKRKSR
jgi:hypothetical protein